MATILAQRPYVVLKEFSFRGLSFKSGDIFDPVKAQCDGSRLRVLVAQRYLDVSAVPGEGKNPPVVNEKATAATVGDTAKKLQEAAKEADSTEEDEEEEETTKTRRKS
jgi:hypothetical protein